MKLKLFRYTPQEKCILGDISINGHFFCFSLENKEKAILHGIYKVIISYSPKFKTELPELLDVPNRNNIRIHSGNTAEDTDGCIIIGFAKGNDCIYRSKVALKSLIQKLKNIPKGENIEIEII